MLTTPQLSTQDDDAHRAETLRSAASTFASISLVGFGAVFVTSLAASTQVWGYPMARGIFICLAMQACIAILYAFCAYCLVEVVPKVSIALGTWTPRLAVVLFFSAVILNLVGCFEMYRGSPYISQLIGCVYDFEAQEMCNLTPKDINSSQATKMLLTLRPRTSYP